MSVDSPLELVAAAADIHGLEEVVRALKFELAIAKERGDQQVGEIAVALDDIKRRVGEIEQRLADVEGSH